jgi:hypothetical protein
MQAHAATMLIAVLTVGLVGCTTAPSGADAGPYPARYREIAQSHLKTTLFDPYSARDFQVASPKVGQMNIPGTFSIETGWLVCYRGNAKNRMGAYTGVKDSAMLIRNDNVITSNEDPNHYEVRTNCRDVKYEPISLS